MINQAAIIAWKDNAPWVHAAMVEQDLIICKALVCIFGDEFLASQLAFRGGTALHKLYLHPQQRYSEDIDLVQINPGPIKPILLRLGEVLSWLPDKVTKQKRYNNTMLFRMESEVPPVQPLRLKVEINCYEHFCVLGLQKVPFEVRNPWFNGRCEITTYALDELVGTKLRALYQRKKGRDLFDLQVALQSGRLDVQRVLECYQRYMTFVVDKVPTYKQYVQNMEEKMQDDEFHGDMDLLLREDAGKFNPIEAYEQVRAAFIEQLPGKRE